MDGMDGGAEGRRSALQKQNRPRIQTSLSGTVRGGKEVEEGRGLHANSISRQSSSSRSFEVCPPTDRHTDSLTRGERGHARAHSSVNSRQG